MVLANGNRQVIQQGVTADFHHGDITEWERRLALEKFLFNGMPTELDEVTPIDPTYRLSSFDSADIDDPELRKETEEKLMTSNMNGIDFIAVERPKLAPPWPTYDVWKPGKGNPFIPSLLEKLVEDGISLESTLVYERENLNRSHVVEALEGALKGTQEDDVVLA